MIRHLTALIINRGVSEVQREPSKEHKCFVLKLQEKRDLYALIASINPMASDTLLT